MQEVNVEQIMSEIRREAAEKPAYEPSVDYSNVKESVVDNPAQNGGVHRFGRKVKNKIKTLFSKFVRIFVAMYLFAKSQLAEGKNVILQNAARINELSAYVYGDMARKLEELEKENSELKTALCKIESDMRGNER